MKIQKYTEKIISRSGLYNLKHFRMKMICTVLWGINTVYRAFEYTEPPLWICPGSTPSPLHNQQIHSGAMHDINIVISTMTAASSVDVQTPAASSGVSGAGSVRCVVINGFV